MVEDKDINVEKREKKSDSSKVGVAVIKSITYLIIFFGLLWFIVNYIFPMF